MPQAGNSRGGQTRARRAKRRTPPSRSDAAQRTGARTPRPKTPPVRHAPPKQRGHAGEGGRTISPRNRRPTPIPQTVPQDIFGGPVFSREQAQARRRAERARRRLPEVPLPAIPSLSRPTRAQQRVARQLVKRAIDRFEGPQSTRRAIEVLDILMSDPRSVRRLAPVSRAAAAKLDRMFAGRARAAGYTGTRAELAQVGRALAGQHYAKPGQRSRISLPGASIEFNPAAIRSAIGAATSLDVGDAGPRQFLSRVGGDLKTLGTAPFVGGVEVGQGVLQTLRTGETDRLEDLAVEAAKGTAETIRHPIESFEKNPLLTALTFGGATSVVGRTGGAVARGAGKKDAGGVRGKLDRIGTTVRPPVALVDDAAAVRRGEGLVERSYSRDLTRKAAQEARDSRREKLRDADGNVVTVKQRGREVPVLKPTTREREAHGRRQANFEAGRANASERLEREQAGRGVAVPNRAQAVGQRAVDRTRRSVWRTADRELRGLGVKGRRARDAVLMVAGGTVRTAKTFRKDLEAERARIADALERHERGEPVYLDKGEVQTARENVKLIDKLLVETRDKPELVKRIVETGERIGRRLNETEEEALALRVLSSRPRAERARVIHTAVSHQGARYFREDELRELERQGVEVRDPRAEKRYREARGTVGKAKEGHAKALAKVKRLETARAKLTGAQASRRGRRSAEGGVATATKPEKAKLAKADAELKAARQEAAKTKKALRDAEQKLGGVKRPPIREALRGPDGRFLSTQAIRDALEAEGRDPDTVAYVPTNQIGGRAFHARFDRNRPVMDKAGTRTGEQHRKGATETTVAILTEQGIRQATQIAKARQIDNLVRGGAARPDGRYWTFREAEEAAARIDVDTRGGGKSGDRPVLDVLVMRDGQRMVPMRAFAAKLDAETKAIISREQGGPAGMESLHRRMLNDRIVHGEDPNARNVVLVPASKLETLDKHLRPASVIEKFFQLLNKPFRMAVLPQPRWLTGNFAEPYIVRLTINGSGLNVFGLANDWRAAGKALKAMERSGDPRLRQAAREIRAHQFGGLFIGGRGASNRRGIDDFPRLERLYGEMVARLPVTKQAAEVSGMALRVLLSPLNAFFRVNRVIESGAQRAAFGHQFRKDLQEFQGSWIAAIRLQQKAIDEAVKGHVNTPTQHRFMREQHKLLGQYEGFNPALRAWVQGPMPFLPWALNAARFVYWTMPAEHTALTAALVQVNQVVAKDWEEIHQNVPPGGLKFALPTEKGGWVDLARYTPYGLITGGEGTITGQIAPHFQGAIKAIGGDDPFGRQLQVDPREHGGRTEPTKGENWAIAGYSLAEALLPYLSTARRLQEGGGTAYAGSTVFDQDVKPGTSNMSAGRRTFDPFRPTYLRGGGGALPADAGNTPRAPRSADPVDRALEQIATEQAEMDASDAAIDEALRRLGSP